MSRPSPAPAGRRAHGALLYLDDIPLATTHGDFRLHRFRNFATRHLALAATVGDVASARPLLARVHSCCVTSEALGACDCDCAEQLSIALAEIVRAGRGVVFYLMQEGRGAGFAAKARDRMIVQASGHRLTTFEAYEQMGLGRDHRRYDEVESMRRLLDVSAPLRLLSNNPEKVAALEAEGVPIQTVRPLANRATAFNVHYISAKRRSGHALDDRDAADPAVLPEPVESFLPHAIVADPSIAHVASYLLPIRVGGEADPTRWFRLHLYVDGAGRDRVVLVHRRDPRQVPRVGVRRDTLYERFPLRAPAPGWSWWRDAVAEISSAGAGCVLLRSGAAAAAEVDETDVRLLERHLSDRRAMIFAGKDAEPLSRALRAGRIALESSCGR